MERLDINFVESKRDVTLEKVKNIAAAAGMPITDEEAQEHVDEAEASQVFVSTTHEVIVRESDNGGVYLSIKRNDREPMGD